MPVAAPTLRAVDGGGTESNAGITPAGLDHFVEGRDLLDDDLVVLARLDDIDHRRRGRLVVFRARGQRVDDRCTFFDRPRRRARYELRHRRAGRLQTDPDDPAMKGGIVIRELGGQAYIYRHRPTLGGCGQMRPISGGRYWLFARGTAVATVAVGAAVSFAGWVFMTMALPVR